LALFVVFIFFVGPISYLVTYQDVHWSQAKRESAKIAPETSEATIQVYAAKIHGWRGAFAVHTWFSIKDEGEEEYTVIEKLGWLYFKGLHPIVIKKDLPDRYWYGSKPTMILQITGKKAKELIPDIINASKDYPYSNLYRYWPGPNSNTFVAYVARKVPKLGLIMPPNAIGKDYLPLGEFFTTPPSGSGYQFCIGGVFGLIISFEEGIQINILGLEIGINFNKPALILPGFGYLGFSN
jgi:hypothetical protein